MFREHSMEAARPRRKDMSERVGLWGWPTPEKVSWHVREGRGERGQRNLFAEA